MTEDNYTSRQQKVGNSNEAQELGESNSTDLLCTMPKELTAENGAKGLLIGEFKVDVEYCDNDGDTFIEQVDIPWTTIKEIYAMAVKNLST